MSLPPDDGGRMYHEGVDDGRLLRHKYTGAECGRAGGVRSRNSQGVSKITQDSY